MGSSEHFFLPNRLTNSMSELFSDWDRSNRMRRLWERDTSVWTETDEDRWLGWVEQESTDEQLSSQLVVLCESVAKERFACVALLGMGGSSRTAEVLRSVFEPNSSVKFQILGSTEPASIRAFEDSINLERTLFVVASKSGSTLETDLFEQYFHHRVEEELGKQAIGSHFVALTDKDSPLYKRAIRMGYRQVLLGNATIGGRFSALSVFGLLPAAVMSLNVQALLFSAKQMMKSCGPDVEVEDNPGLRLGVALGAASRHGMDKITLVVSPAVLGFGGWIEQLLAESTGKSGVGLIPVASETLGAPEVYESDRFFVVIRLAEERNFQKDKLKRLERSGHPVVSFVLDGRYDLGAEFFRWQIATAVAGSVLGINPFDQPDVEASKRETIRSLKDCDTRRKVSGHEPIVQTEFEGGVISVYADEMERQVLANRGGQDSLKRVISAHCGRLRPGDYFSVMAYLRANDAYNEKLQLLRHFVRDSIHVATIVGFGPGLLHSTGQLFKGGPRNGVFVQITCRDVRDIAIPGRGYSFGDVKKAQSEGDMKVLRERGQRVIRVHVDGPILSGLTILAETFRNATSALGFEG